MTRKFFTVCNACGNETQQYEPRGWVSLSVRVQFGSKGNQDAYADLCSPECQEMFVRERLSEWLGVNNKESK